MSGSGAESGGAGRDGECLCKTPRGFGGTFESVGGCGADETCGWQFKTLEWSLTTDDDGRVIQLLDNEGRDPLQGTATSGSMGQS